MLDDFPEGAADRLLPRLPTLQALFGSGGVRFSDAFSNDPLCCPGRATFLTGLYAHHHGVVVNNGRAFRPEMTLATRLDDAGYHTFVVGKYLNSAHTLPDITPPGWDHTSIVAGGYYDYLLLEDGAVRRRGSQARDYSTDVSRAAALRLLRKAPADAPIFAWISPNATHGGTDPRTGLIGQPVPAPRHLRDARCQGVGRWRPAGFNEADLSDKPTFLRNLREVPYPKGWPLVKSCEALLSVDELLAAVVAELRAQDRYEDTIFVLTADNGVTWGDHRWPYKKLAYATPLTLHVHWPARHGGPREDITRTASNIDIAPTLLDAAGAAPLGPFPGGRSRPDGVSLLDFVMGDDRRLYRYTILEERLAVSDRVPGWCGVRTTDESTLGRWHFIRWQDGQRELYDLEADPGELENRAGQPKYHTVESVLAARLASMSENDPACGGDGRPGQP